MPTRLSFLVLAIIASLAVVAGFLSPSVAIRHVANQDRCGALTRLRMAKGFSSKPPRQSSSSKTLSPESQCPCHSGKIYSDCCMPFHEDTAIATPVELMRSRYSAYASNKPDYIMETTHPKDREYGMPDWREKIVYFCENYNFVGLYVSEPETDPKSDNIVRLSFKASFVGPQGPLSFEENSVFVREGEGKKWFYGCIAEEFDDFVKAGGIAGGEYGG